MKKFIIKFLALCASISLILCLCSCVDLDEIRQSRANFINEQQTEVEFQGTIYKQLDKRLADYLSTYMLSSSAHAAESDVPLLLTEQYGKWMDYSAYDTRLIAIESVYYCREDIYDYAVDLTEKNEFKYTCIELYDYQTGKYTTKMLDSSFIDIVDEIIYSTEPISEYPEIYSEVSVMATDKTALFMHNLFQVSIISGGRYFISMDNLADDICGYLVPEKYEADFKVLFPQTS